MPDGHIPLTESQAEALFPELIVIDVWVWDVYFPCNVNFHKATFIESSVIWDIREMTNNQEMVELLSPKGVGMAQTDPSPGAPTLIPARMLERKLLYPHICLSLTEQKKFC